MPAAIQKSIFITGGAGGMGLATGQLFADNGWFVGCSMSTTTASSAQLSCSTPTAL